LIGFFLLGPLGLSCLLSFSYGDDRTAVAGNHPIAAESAVAASPANPNTKLNLQIRFALRHKAALQRLLAEQQNPTSPNYHKWLTTGEFFRRFGPTRPEVKAVTEWLGNEGFEVSNLAPGYIEFRGSVDQAQRTFAIKIARFANAYGNTSDPFIPARFANVVGAVTGLDNMTRAVPASRPNDAFVSPDAIVGGNQAFGPNDLRTFYDEKPAPGRDGGGDCVAVVGISDFLDSTMSAFTTQFNLSPISYTREVHGTNPGINGAEVEAELDLQWAHATAPGAAIVYYLGGYLVDDISGAVNDNQCGAISISYGFCGPSAAFITGVIDPLFQQAAAQGQSVFVSAGDQGAAGLGFDPASGKCFVNNYPSVNEMSADPNVTSVGGTQFNAKYSGGNDTGYIAEGVWNDISGAGGGGASAVFAKPDYQNGSGVPNDGARDIPDVALMASPNSPGAFFGHDMSGSAQVVCCVGGTSLSAPLWAGLSRVIAEQAGEPRLGNLSPIIYELANNGYAGAGFHDVTIGNNGYNQVPGFNAGPGYDEASGWGSVDFDAFIDAASRIINPSLATPTPTTPATPTPTPTPSGGVLSIPTKVKFPATATGRPGMMVIRNLSRTSSLSLEVGAVAAPFTISGAGQYSLAPMASITVGVFLMPSTTGTIAETVQIASSDPRHSRVGVQLSASVRGGRLTMPSAVSLRTSMSTVVTKTVMIRNSGYGVISGIAQTSGGSAPFTLMGGPVSFWLVPGKSQPITIQFRPLTAGMAQGSVVVTTANPATSASIAVSGTAK